MRQVHYEPVRTGVAHGGVPPGLTGGLYNASDPGLVVDLESAKGQEYD